MSFQADLETAIKDKSSLFLSSNAINLAYETLALAFENNCVTIKNNVPFNDIANFSKGSSYTLQFKNFRVHSQSFTTDGIHIVFPIEKSQTLENSRNESRNLVGSSNSLKVIIKNPFDNETLIPKKIIDISESGISIQVKKGSKLFTPGVVIDHITLKNPGQDDLKMSGKIVYVREYFSLSCEKFCQVGLSTSTV